MDPSRTVTMGVGVWGGQDNKRGGGCNPYFRLCDIPLGSRSCWHGGTHIMLLVHVTLYIPWL